MEAAEQDYFYSPYFKTHIYTYEQLLEAIDIKAFELRESTMTDLTFKILQPFVELKDLFKPIMDIVNQIASAAGGLGKFIKEKFQSLVSQFGNPIGAVTAMHKEVVGVLQAAIDNVEDPGMKGKMEKGVKAFAATSDYFTLMVKKIASKIIPFFDKKAPAWLGQHVVNLVEFLKFIVVIVVFMAVFKTSFPAIAGVWIAYRLGSMAGKIALKPSSILNIFKMVFGAINDVADRIEGLLGLNPEEKYKQTDAAFADTLQDIKSKAPEGGATGKSEVDVAMDDLNSLLGSDENKPQEEVDVAIADLTSLLGTDQVKEAAFL